MVLAGCQPSEEPDFGLDENQGQDEADEAWESAYRSPEAVAERAARRKAQADISSRLARGEIKLLT